MSSSKSYKTIWATLGYLIGKEQETVVMIDTRHRDLVGIDDIAVYVPKLFIPMTGEFAASRGIDPGKLTKGIGIERMAIPDKHEDAATMAAMSLLGLMRRNDLNPKDIGKIYIGTESGVDEAKAIGTYVVGMLEMVYGQGSFEECSTVEFKSACIGATHALENLFYWSSVDDDRAGVVVASDVARYQLRSSGEYTQGAGSVSLLVKRNPRLVALEGIFGVFTRDENDFFRPLGSKTAVVNGRHSNDCYLDAMEGAFNAYVKRALQRTIIKMAEDECATDHIEHLLFHIPYPRMVEYASSAIFRREWRHLSRWREIEAEIGKEPKPKDFTEPNDYAAAAANYDKKFSKASLFQRAYDAKVKESAQISRQVGNIYTGSIYLGLASLAEGQNIHSGERICFGSYGSGCSATVFSGIVQPQAATLPARNIWKILTERRAVSLDEYEMLHQGRMADSILQPSDEFALMDIDGQGYRHYKYMR
ncbi:MAG: hydroxymethylglutaryl-CoA synthase family protein [Methanotrichaceae archaeon]